MRDRIKFAAASGAIVATLLTGCTIERAQVAAKAQTTMVGMTKEQVLACMGTPNRAGKADATEVWTYETGDNQTNTIGGATIFGRTSIMSNSTSFTRSCKVDVVMSQGRVMRVNYSGLTGGLFSAGEECAYAVDHCIDQSAPGLAIPVSAPAPVDTAPTSPPAPTTQFKSYDQWSNAR